MNLTKKLQKMNACVPAIEWVKQMNGSNPEKLWNECERGDWMLWLVGKLDIDRKRLVLAACQCARLVEHLMKDEHSIRTIEVAEAWVHGKATLEELDRAAAAYAYAYAYAVYAYAYAAAAYDDARDSTLIKCANIARQHFTFDEVRGALQSED